MFKGLFKVTGKNNDGEWQVIRPDGLMCNGTWKTKESAQLSCNKWNTNINMKLDKGVNYERIQNKQR